MIERENEKRRRETNICRERDRRRRIERKKMYLSTGNRESQIEKENGREDEKNNKEVKRKQENLSEHQEREK